MARKGLIVKWNYFQTVAVSIGLDVSKGYADVWKRVLVKASEALLIVGADGVKENGLNSLPQNYFIETMNVYVQKEIMKWHNEDSFY